jgi:ketosteroid isomerase-like protein
MKYFSLVICAAMLLALAACNHQKAGGTEATASAFSLDSVKAQIAGSNAVFGDCFGKNDSTSFVNCYTENGCINPPGMPQMCGRAAIGAFFSEGVKMGMRQIKITIGEVLGGKDGVTETGKYEVFGDGGVSFEKGKYMVMWIEENGKWKMHRDVWNSDTPVPAPSK